MKQLDLMYQGKAKSVYRSDEQGNLIMQFRDDITAFDGGKKDVLGEKVDIMPKSPHSSSGTWRSAALRPISSA